MFVFRKNKKFSWSDLFLFFDIGLKCAPGSSKLCYSYPAGVNSIQGTGVLNKNRLRKCTIIVDKQLQKRQHSHFEQRTPSKEAVQC